MQWYAWHYFQGTSVLSPLGPIGLLIGLAITIWMKSPTDVFQNNIVLYIVSFGMASSKITNKLVVSLAVFHSFLTWYIYMLIMAWITCITRILRLTEVEREKQVNECRCRTMCEMFSICVHCAVVSVVVSCRRESAKCWSTVFMFLMADCSYVKNRNGNPRLVLYWTWSSLS